MSEGEAKMVWPIEARTIEEARKIWVEQGFSIARTMTREEVERLFPSRTKPDANAK